MASISQALERIKQDLGNLIPANVVERICQELKYKYRKRKLDPLTTIHLFVQQILNYNTAFTHLPHLSGLDFDPSAYGDARKRLPLRLIQRLVRTVAETLRDEMNQRGLWMGHRTWLVDGSTCSMPDTPDLQEEFGQPSSQKPGCGFPVAHLLAMFDAYSGMLLEVLAFPYRTHDMSKVWALHPLLQAGDVVVGDRGFCSYAHIAALQMRGIDAVIRIHQRIIVRFRDKRQRRRKLKPAKGEPRSRLIRKLGKQDQLVEWYKPEKKPEYMTQEQYDQLPESMVVRELRYRIQDRGCRTYEITLTTTLLDPGKYSKRKLARLFGVRWQVELDLRNLKITLKMDVLKCKSPEGVRKELAIYALVYNLVCLVREKAARRQRVQPGRISFVDVLRWLQCAQPGTDLPTFVVNPLRPRRHEPRVVKRRPKKYPRMTKPRAEYKKSLNSHRKEA
jgi:hypothetical protein